MEPIEIGLAASVLNLLALLDVKSAFIPNYAECSGHVGLLVSLFRQLKLCNPYPCIYLNSSLCFAIELIATIL